MPVTKESVLGQAAECRRRLDLVLDLKRDVVDCLDNVTRTVNNQLSEIELLTPDADNGRIASIEQKLEKAINALQSFESEIARFVRDHNDPELKSLLPRIRKFTSLPAAVDASNQAASSGRTSQTQQGNMTSRWLEETARSTGLAASMRAMSINDRQPMPINQVSKEGNIGSGSNNQLDGSFTEPSTVEIQLIGPADSASSLRVETGSVASAKSSASATISKTAVTFPFSVAGDTTNAVDYRKVIVSKGNGNPADFCQRSVELTACRMAPLKCSVSHAEHPSFFFVHLYTNNVVKIEEDLNITLESGMKTLSKPKVGDYCVAAMHRDDDLHRAKILEIKNNNLGVSFSKLFYIDWGVVDWVATKALLEMPQRFRQFTRQACPCMLAEVEPVSGYWDDDTIALFSAQTNSYNVDNAELAIMSLDQGEPPEINTVSLSRTNKPAAGATMLFVLIRNGNGRVKRAEPLVPMKAFEKQNGEPIGGRNPPDVTNDWRCTVRTAEKSGIAQASAAASAAVVSAPAAVQHAAKGRSIPTSVSVTGSSGTANGPSRFVQGSIPALTYKELVELEKPLHFQAREWENKRQLVFHAQLVDKNGRNEQLEALTEALDEFYSKTNNQRLFDKMDPQYAVYRQLIDGQEAYRRVYISNWRPAKDFKNGKDIRVNSEVEAFFVDYGYSKVLHTKSVHPLDRRFCSMPAQAFLCKLFEVQPLTQSGFTDMAVDIFQQLCKGVVLKGTILNQSSPFEVVAYRIDGSGKRTCINEEMVGSGQAISSTDWK